MAGRAGAQGRREMGYASAAGRPAASRVAREASTIMSFCEHCAGQRFDRAQVLRVLRATQRELRAKGGSCAGAEALALAINRVRSLEIPHLELLDDSVEGEVIH